MGAVEKIAEFQNFLQNFSQDSFLKHHAKFMTSDTGNEVINFAERNVIKNSLLR